MEARWGIGVLERLVSPDTAAKFGSARKKLNDAVVTDDWQEVAKRASVMIRGWQALESEAMAAGHVPNDISALWAIESDNGKKYVFVQHERDMPAAIKKFPDHNCWAMSEVVRILAQHSMEAAAASRVKDVFPGATVVELRPPKSPLSAIIDDEIPF
ncbi:hypothetical protein [Labrys neptuniae]